MNPSLRPARPVLDSFAQPPRLRQAVRRFACAALVLAGASALYGCVVGPRYERAPVDIPAAYKEAPPPGWIAARPDDSAAADGWWHVFGDSTLDTLEGRVNVSNQNIRKALAALQQARSNVSYARAGYAPSVGASLDPNRTRYSANVIDSAKSGHAISDYAAALTVSWEPDLWGKVRHSVEAANASEQASAADLNGIRLSMQAELAIDYFNLRGSDASRQLLDDNIAALRQALTLTTNRFDAGIAAQADVAQARTQLAATEAQAIDLGVLRAQYEHAIATLSGTPASQFTLAPAIVHFAPPAIPPGIPSAMLQRRPDVAAAERRMAAANAQIGIAQAARYPDLMLALSGGVESSALSGLLTAPSRMWAIAPSLVSPLFDGGARRSVVAGAQAQYSGSVADYRQTVLNALQETEDSLAALAVLQREADKQNEAVNAARQTLQLQNNQYRAGSVGYLEVVSAQSTALSNERLALDVQRRQMDASVELIKALGGAW